MYPTWNSVNRSRDITGSEMMFGGYLLATSGIIAAKTPQKRFEKMSLDRQTK